MGSNIPPKCARKYRPQRELASGGFGAVWLAEQAGLERPVALKVLHAEALADADVLRRFLDEAKMTAALCHPNIVVVLDHGVEDGVPWIAYEYVPGPTLREQLARGRLPVPDALRIGAQVASALEEAHAQGVLHRDIKPENVLMMEPGRVKIADFGIAKSADMAARTREGLIVGTPGYIAPERIRGDTPTAQADVYAVGALLYEAIVGELPFRADGPVRVMERQLSEDPAAPSARLGGLSPAVDRVVLRALAREPAERFPTARDLRQAVERALFEVSGDVVSVMTPQQPAQPATARVERTPRAYQPTLVSAAAAAPRRTTLQMQRAARPVLLTITVLGLVLLAGVHALKGRAPQPVAPATPSARPAPSGWRDPRLAAVDVDLAAHAERSKKRFSDWRGIGGQLSVSNPNAGEALARAASFGSSMKAELPHLDELLDRIERVERDAGGATPYTRFLRARLASQTYVRAVAVERCELFHERLANVRAESAIEFINLLEKIEMIPPSARLSRMHTDMGRHVLASLDELAEAPEEGAARIADLLDDLRWSGAWLWIIGRTVTTEAQSRAALRHFEAALARGRATTRAALVARAASGVWDFGQLGTTTNEGRKRARETLGELEGLADLVPAARPGLVRLAGQLRSQLAAEPPRKSAR